MLLQAWQGIKELRAAIGSPFGRLNRYKLQTGSSHEVFGKVKLYTLEIGLGLGAENEIQSVNLKFLIIIFD